MIREQFTVGYDDFMPQPRQERIEMFNNISAENRALITKTHVERWVSVNRDRLDPEQSAVVEEMLRFITPEMYRDGRDEEKVYEGVEAIVRRMEAVLPREDVKQIAFDGADYIPSIEERIGTSGEAPSRIDAPERSTNSSANSREKR